MNMETIYSIPTIIIAHINRNAKSSSPVTNPIISAPIITTSINCSTITGSTITGSAITGSTIGKSYLINSDTKYYLNQRILGIIPNINIKYFYYYYWL